MNPDNGAYTGLVDAHCHLQDGFLRHALAPALIRARAAGVTLMCCNGTGEDDWDYVLGLGRTHEDVHVSLGLASLPDKLTGTVMVVPAEDGLLLSDQPGQYYKAGYKLAAELLTAVPVVAYDLKELASRFLRRNLPVKFVANYDVGQ